MVNYQRKVALKVLLAAPQDVKKLKNPDTTLLSGLFNKPLRFVLYT